jgi:hypothetical protein
MVRAAGPTDYVEYVALKRRFEPEDGGGDAQ